MARNRTPVAELRERDMWTLPEFGKVLGRSSQFLYRRRTVDATGRGGWIELPGGVRVPYVRSPRNRDVIYKVDYEAAQARRAQQSVAS